MIEIRKASRKAVRHACLKFHYARSVPAMLYSYNVYQGDDWCGCILFSHGANNHIACPFGLVQGEVLELVRVALNGKQAYTSECVAAALKTLHKEAPQVKIVVSYADLDHGHSGVIYQATNWLYLGLAAPIHSFIIHGKKTHFKTIYSKYGFVNLDWIRKNIDPNASDFKPGGKHKYIYCFERRLRREWAKKALPYPKNGEV